MNYPRPTVRVLGFPWNKEGKGGYVEARIWSHNRNKRPARVVCDVQAANIPASRGIAIREKSAVRPFSIESDPIGSLVFGVVITRDRECRFEGNILFLPLRYFLLAN